MSAEIITVDTCIVCERRRVTRRPFWGDEVRQLKGEGLCDLKFCRPCKLFMGMLVTSPLFPDPTPPSAA